MITGHYLCGLCHAIVGLGVHITMRRSVGSKFGGEVSSRVLILRSRAGKRALFRMLAVAVVALSLSGTALGGLRFESSSSTTITISWKAPGDDGSMGTASQYDIRYSTSLITEANWATATQVAGEPAPTTAGVVQTYTVSGLTPFTTYYVAIKAADEVPNWSGLSNVVTHTTCDSPLGPTLVSPGNNAIDLAQPIVLDWSTEATATSYDVQVDDNSNFSSPVYSTNRTLSYLTVTGLSLDTRYYWRVRSVNSCGVSSWTAAWSFVTQGLVSGAEDITACSDTVYGTSRPILMLWNGERSESNRYYFEVADDSSFLPATIVTRSDEVEEESDGSASWHIDRTLTAGHTYYWRAALNSEGYSSIFKFTVDPANMHVYPSPFDRTLHENITFTEVPEKATLVVTTLYGDVVREWTNTTGEDIVWNGTNEAGRNLAPGAYFWFVRESDQKGKFTIIE